MLTQNEIKRLIDEDIASEKKRRAKEGMRYYEGDHDILQYRLFYYNADGILVEDKTRANNRICHPFFTELVDQLASYVMSFEENPITAKDNAEGLQDHLDLYFDDEFWAEVQELIIGANSKGFEYLYAYKDITDRLRFECADSLGVVEVRAKDTDDHCEYVIYWYVDRIKANNKTIKRIQVFSKDEIWFYEQDEDGAITLDEDEPINPKPNVLWTDTKTGGKYGQNLGFIPFWRLDNDRKQFGGLKPIKALIDDYDLMECGLSNNLQDFDTPIHLVKGFEGDDLSELQHNIKTKKVVGVGEGGGLDILTVDVPYQARKAKADEDEKNIYRFGMGFNSSQVGDGNVTNVVIRSRYTLLDLKAKKLITRLKRFLKPIIQVVLDEINKQNGTDYQYTDVVLEFHPVVPTNEQETVQNEKTTAEAEQIRINTILSIAAMIGDDKALEAICAVMDWDFEELQGVLEKLNEEKKLTDAKNALNNVVTDDEQTAEISSATILE